MDDGTSANALGGTHLKYTISTFALFSLMLAGCGKSETPSPHQEIEAPRTSRNWINPLGGYSCQKDAINVQWSLGFVNYRMAYIYKVASEGTRDCHNDYIRGLNGSPDLNIASASLANALNKKIASLKKYCEKTLKKTWEGSGVHISNWAKTHTIINKYLPEWGTANILTGINNPSGYVAAGNCYLN